jgi:hypothetical protein
MSQEAPCALRGTHVGFSALIGVLSAALLLAGPPEEGSGVFLSAPDTFAFREDGRLRVAVLVRAPEGTAQRRLAGTIYVDLLDAHGNALATDRADIVLDQQPQTVALALDVGEVPARARLRCRFREDVVTVPLSRALLRIPHETTLAVGAELHADSDAFIHCEVHGVRSVTETVPLAAAAVTARLRDITGKQHFLARGRTDAHGTCNLRFRVPIVPPGEGKLEVTTTSALDEQRLVRNVTVLSETRLLVVPDRPVYQPGQRMNLRALLLRPSSLRPVAGCKVTFQISDGRGNKVFQEEVPTSAHGIAAVSFQLADEVNTGEYSIRASVPGHSVVRPVIVKRYALPKFKTELVTDRKFYRPNETVRADLQADYFFGKPLSGARVRVDGKWEGASEPFFTWRGTTDDVGHARWEVPLPPEGPGETKEGPARVHLEVVVTDAAGHQEVIETTCPVSSQPIRVGVIAEGGWLVPELENRLFVVTTYPDGSPASCDVELWRGREARGKPIAKVHTDATGVAELLLTPPLEWLGAAKYRLPQVEVAPDDPAEINFTVQARDRRGEHAQRWLTLACKPVGENVLLRLDKALYRASEKMLVKIQSTANSPTMHVDLVSDGQLVATRELTLKDGTIEEAIELPPSCLGTVDVHASQYTKDSGHKLDSRVIYVHPARELKIAVRPDRNTYRPAAEGTIHFEVTDWRGRPATAALGVLIVDEAVYALHDVQPGLEKVHFTFRSQSGPPGPSPEEDVHPPGDMRGLIRAATAPGDVAVELRKQRLAQALLAGASPDTTLVARTAPALQRQSQLQRQLQRIGQAMLHHVLEGEPFQLADGKGGWKIRPRLLAELVRDGELFASDLTLPTGEALTLADLPRLEPGFTAERLARALTSYRCRQLATFLAAEVVQIVPPGQKAARWVMPEGALERVLKSRVGVENGRDAWGRPFRLVPLAAPRRELCGVEQLEEQDLQSAGPDGKFGTADDVTFTARTGWLLPYWWQSEAALEKKWAAACNPFHADNWRVVYDSTPYVSPNDLWRGGWGGFGIGGLAGVAGFGGGLGGFGGGGFGGGFGGGGFGGGFAGVGGLGGLAGIGGMPRVGGLVGPKGPNPWVDENRVPGPGADEEEKYPAPRVRRHFPETMLWQPELITDEHGKASVPVHFADSITTWRLAATASSVGGGIGSAAAPLRVFQDFFVDIDLPPLLTRNDEVSVPIAVYNYTKGPQTVNLELQPAPWFELIDGKDRRRAVDLKANEVRSVSYRIRAKQVGRFALTVAARGKELSDAVRRAVEVIPDGQKIEQVVSDRLAGDVRHTFDIPASATPGGSRLLVKVHPNILSQALEGIESILQAPHGCFEQTSATVYPNLLVLDYFHRTGSGRPDVRARAEAFLREGYQRLLTFECRGGGFSLWGQGEASLWLTALGIHELTDMGRVFQVDPAVMQRARAYLVRHQWNDGSWSEGGDRLRLTSYIAWALGRSDPHAPEVKKALAYLRKSESKLDTPYLRALAANALACEPEDAVLARLVARLEADRQEGRDGVSCWFASPGQSITFGEGGSLTIETTALAVLAMRRSGKHAATVDRTVRHLARTRTSNGGWGSTQATVLALQALVPAAGDFRKGEPTNFTIMVNGKEVSAGTIDPKNNDLLQQFDLTEHLRSGHNEVVVRPEKKTVSMVQVVARHYQPWERPPREGALQMEIAHDRTRLTLADTVRATLTLRQMGKNGAPLVTAEVGLPPGFNVSSSDFEALVKAGRIQKFEMAAGRVLLYLDGLRPGGMEKFTYTLTPKYPLKVQVPPSVAYEYYTPSRRALAAPVELVVEAGR